MTKQNRFLFYLLLIPAFMVGLSFASVPLYQLFCQVTGFGGTTQVTTQASDVILDRNVKINFVSNTNRDLPWAFKAKQSVINIKIGQEALAFYEVENVSNQEIVGVATYNVSPPKAGLYFQKIDCFCFENQTLKPGEKITLPVYFYIDPEIVNDPDLKNIGFITLSYSFFRQKNDKSL